MLLLLCRAARAQPVDDPVAEETPTSGWWFAVSCDLTLYDNSLATCTVLNDLYYATSGQFWQSYLSSVPYVTGADVDYCQLPGLTCDEGGAGNIHANVQIKAFAIVTLGVSGASLAWTTWAINLVSTTIFRSLIWQKSPTNQAVPLSQRPLSQRSLAL